MNPPVGSAIASSATVTARFRVCLVESTLSTTASHAGLVVVIGCLLGDDGGGRPDFADRIWAGEDPATAARLSGEAALAQRFAEAMLARGVYVVGFFYPVVPQGKARIRTQISAAHTRADLEFAVEAFSAVKAELGL